MTYVGRFNGPSHRNNDLAQAMTKTASVALSVPTHARLSLKLGGILLSILHRVVTRPLHLCVHPSVRPSLFFVVRLKNFGLNPQEPTGRPLKSLSKNCDCDFVAVLQFLVACYATLQPALSVRRSVGPSVRPSITLYFVVFFFFCGLWPHCSCPNDQVTSNTAPAHPHTTGVAMYPALFFWNRVPG